SSRLLSGGRKRRFQACVFKPASRANRSARNRAVFSLVAARAASYSAIACCPSCSCCSFFLKAASARSRARLASVSNLLTPILERTRLQDSLPCLRDRMPPADVGCSTEPMPVQVILFRAPELAPGFVWTLPPGCLGPTEG